MGGFEYRPNFQNLQNLDNLFHSRECEPCKKVIAKAEKVQP